VVDPIGFRLSSTHDHRRIVAAVTAVGDHVTTMLPRLASRPELAPRQIAAAFLARCNRLLLSMVLLESNGFPDVAGLPLRPLIESWYLGMFLLFSPDEAMQVIRAAHLHQLRKFDETWDLDDSIEAWVAAGPPIIPRQINWADLTIRVGNLMVAHGYEGARNTAERLYEVTYRSESTVSVHAGYGTVMGHIDERSSSLGVLEVRREPDAGAVRLHLAAALVEGLARAIAQAFGLGTARLDNLGRLLATEAIKGYGTVNADAGELDFQAT
jgi:hypothetical protein